MLFIINGHGAGDPGACGNGYQEAERVRALSERIKVFGGNEVTIGDPSKNWYKSGLVNNNNIPKGAKVLELHMDSSSAPARGGHVVIDADFEPDAYDKALAKLISTILPGRSNTIVKRNDLANPNRAQSAGINYRLMECGFISNAEDVKIFNDKMDEIAKGILDCFNISYDKNETVVKPVAPTPSVKPQSTPAPTPVVSNKVDVTYAVKIEGGRILPEVKNLSDYAGIENKKITGVAIKVNKGSIKYQVHVLGGGWLPWVTGYNWNDHNNGYAGNGKVIDAIRVYYSTPSDLVSNGGYREAKYRISPIGSTGYYDWQLDDTVNKSKGMDGYAGAFGKAIDKFQICIE